MTGRHARPRSWRLPFRIDLSTRLVATAAEAGCGFLLTYLAGWDSEWAVAIAAGATVIRGAFLRAKASGSLPLDVLERTIFTALEASLGLVTVQMLHVPVGLAVPAATLLAWAKGYAGKVAPGTSPATASLLPARDDPFAAPADGVNDRSRLIA